MAKYEDIFIRDSLSDQGTVPYPPGYEMCPDLIPKVSPISAGEVPTKLTSTYSEDIGENLEEGQLNYIYLRAKNLSGEARTGTITLYYCTEATYLHSSMWVNNVIGSKPISGAAGAVLYCPQPFEWTPPSGEGGYCLVGVVSTPQHPNTVPTMDTVNQWWAWVQGTAGVANRNVHLVNNIPNTGSQWMLQLANPDTAAHLQVVQVTGTGIPSGSTASIYCSSPDAQPPINTGMQQFGETSPVIASSVLPAGFSERMVISFQPPGAFPTGAHVIVKQYVAPNDADDALLADARPAHLVLGVDDLTDTGLDDSTQLNYLGCYTYDLV